MNKKVLIVFIPFLVIPCLCLGWGLAEEKKYLEKRQKDFKRYQAFQNKTEKERLKKVKFYKNEKKILEELTEKKRRFFIKQRKYKVITKKTILAHENELKRREGQYLKNQEAFSEMRKKIRAWERTINKISADEELGL